MERRRGVAISSEPLRLAGTGLSSSGALRNIGGSNHWGGLISLAAAASIGSDTGTLVIGPGGIANSTNGIATNLLTLTGAGDIVVTGAIGGAPGGLTKSGAGTVRLSGTNSYGGVTTVSAGTLVVQNDLALGIAAAGTTVSSGATLELPGGVNVTGEPLTLSGTGGGGGALRSVGGSNYWSGNLTLAAASTIHCPAGVLHLAAPIANGSYLATFTNSGTILLGGNLGSGSGGLTKNGAGLLIVSAANTFTGATTVNAGVLRAAVPDCLPLASAITVSTNGTLDLNGFSQSIRSLAGAGSVLLGEAVLTVNNSSSTTFSGAMSGSGALVKNGAGTFTLSGANTYAGGTTINAGIISVNADSRLGDVSGPLTLNGGQITFSVALTSTRSIILGTDGGTISPGASTLTLAGNISGPGTLTKISTRTMALTGNNTYQGGTIIASGTIAINSDASLGDAGGPVTFTASSRLSTTASFATARNLFLNGGTATFSAGAGCTNALHGVISGAGAFTKSGSGVLMLHGVHASTNTLTISAGGLRLGGNERLADLVPVHLSASSATFDLNGFTETIGSLASSASAKVTLGAGALIAGGNDRTTTFTGVISGTGCFTKAGAGAQILSGANTYTGITTVAGGVLRINANERIANTSSVVVSQGAALNLNNFTETIASLSGAGSVTLGSGKLIAGNAGTATFAGDLSGEGAFTKIGAGTQIFSGTNSHTGLTTVSAGNLRVNGHSSNSAITVSSTATLSGIGAVGAVTVNSGATNAPGAGAPGTLTSGAQTWIGGGHLVWKINHVSGARGGDPGWDWLNISGALNITATAGNKFHLRPVSLSPANAAGLVTNFDNTVTYIWTIASAAGGISGFDPAKFNIVTNAFQNPLGAGAFAVTQTGNDLQLIFTTAALAAVNRVQSGTLTSTGNGVSEVTLAHSVNPTNAFLIFSARHNSSTPGGSMIRGRLASTNTVEFIRAAPETSPIHVQWFLADYAAGVRVQRGEVPQTNTVINVPLSPLSAIQQAFVLWSKTPDPAAVALSDCDPVVGEITSVSNLQFRVSTAPNAAPVIAWQVVEFLHPASLFVQQGGVTNLTGTNLAATATLPVAVNPNATFVLAGYRTAGASAGVGAQMLRAQLADANTLAFDRGSGAATEDIAEIGWQAVQFKDGTVVQSDTAHFDTGVSQTTVLLAASLNTERAICFASAQPFGGQNTGRTRSTGNVPGIASATLAMESSAELSLQRDYAGDEADIGWTVAGLGANAILVLATGGSAISADTTGGDYTSLTGPVYTEIQSGNVGAGTIVLRAPAGFRFDTNAPQPTVLITRTSGDGADALNINGVPSGTAAPITAMTPSNVTFMVSSPSSGGVACSLTWQDLRVRPTAGAPLASGNFTSAGTATLQGVATNLTSWGFLAEVVGAPRKLGFQTLPSSAAVAGVEFAQQPVLLVQDQFGNLIADDNETVVTVTNNGTAPLLGATNVTVVGGVAEFGDLSYQVASTIKLGFAAAGLTATNSGNIIISPAAASRLTITTQPSATATAGVAFDPQPVIRVEDAFGNLRGSDNATVVTADVNLGTDDLHGSLSVAARNGVAIFTNLSYRVAETITIEFTSGSLDSDVSSGVIVHPGVANQLVMHTQPSATATAGAAFARQPVVRLEDAFGNRCVGDNFTVVTASRNAGSGALQGTVAITASTGLATFADLAHKVAGAITLDFTSGGLAGASSENVTVHPAVASSLVFTAQPGPANVNEVLSVSPVLATQDAYGNHSVSGLPASLPVSLILASGDGALIGTTTRDIGTTAGNGTVAFNDLRMDASGAKQLTAAASGLASAVSEPFLIGRGQQTINFDSPGDQIYGATPLTLGATASSGLPVSYAVISGPANVSGNLLALTGIGEVTVEAAQAGNDDWDAATPVSRAFAVGRKTITASVIVHNKVYDGTTSAIIAARSLDGVVDGDEVHLTGGSAAFADPAVGVNKTVMVSGLSLAGVDAGKYLLASGTVTATADILNAVPTLTWVGVQTGALENTPFVLTYTHLLWASDAADIDGDPLSFRVESVSSGTLTKDGDPVEPGVTLLSTNETFVWQPPTNVFGPVVHAFTVRVFDGQAISTNEPAQVFVEVAHVNHAPVLTVPANQIINELTRLMVTNTATDADAGDALAFSLVSAPDGMTVDPTTGVLSWTPGEKQGPGQFIVTVGVTDNGDPPLGDQKSFTVIVRETNSAPMLTVPPDLTVGVGESLSVYGSAADSDWPVNTLRFELLAAPTGMKINAVSGLITWSPTAAQRPSTNVVTLRVTDNGTPPLSDTRSFVVVTLDAPDMVAPVVVISAPVAGTRTSSPFLTVTGTARDNKRVERVLFRLNDGPFEPATGATNWSATLNLAPGTNTFAVKSVDAFGNESVTLTRKFFRIVLAPLTVTKAGRGTVSPDLHGQWLEIGRAFSLTAAPEADHLFSHWSGGVAATSARVTFMMQSNLVLQATFITNKFIATAGTYNGLFADPSGVSHQSAGFFTMKSTSKQAFSGKLYVGGGVYGMSGTLDLAGHGASRPILRKGKLPLLVTLQLDLDHPTSPVTGEVWNMEWRAELIGDRAPFNLSNAPARDFAGAYTLALPGSPGATHLPAGDSYATVTVASNGLISAAGALAEAGSGSKPVTLKPVAVSASRDGYWPFYAQTYLGPWIYSNWVNAGGTNGWSWRVVTNKEYKGAVLGWLNFHPAPARDLGGVLHWIKPGWTNAFQPGGFTNSVAILGSAYVPPAPGVRALELAAGEVAMAEGNLPCAFTNRFWLNTNNAITVLPPNVNTQKLSLTGRSGLLKGQFHHPQNGNAATPVTGVVLQNQNTGRGFFLGTNQSGYLKLEGN